MPPYLTQCAQQTVLDGDRSLSPKKGHSSPPPPYFSAHVQCGQTAAWIKMPLGMDVRPRPRPRDVRWDLAPQTRGHSSPHFRPMSIVAMRTVGRRYTRRCVRLPLHGKWHSSHSTFRPTLLWHGGPSQLLLNICGNIPLSFNDAVHS